MKMSSKNQAVARKQAQEVAGTQQQSSQQVAAAQRAQDVEEYESHASASAQVRIVLGLVWMPFLFAKKSDQSVQHLHLAHRRKCLWFVSNRTRLALGKHASKDVVCITFRTALDSPYSLEDREFRAVFTLWLLVLSFQEVAISRTFSRSRPHLNPAQLPFHSSSYY